MRAPRCWRRWYSFIYEFGALTALMIAGVLIGTWLLLRQTRGLAAQTQALADSAASLEHTNQRFDAALGSMSQGLCMFDADQRVVICNERFLEIYGYPDGLVRPGTPVKEMLDDLVARGVRPGGMAADEYRATLPTLHQEIFHNYDGRKIAIVRTPTPDGGWVSTHEDVTERRRAEALVQAKAAELQAFNERFDIALSSMSQGLCMFDADQRVVICNRRFREIYDYPEDLVRPGTPLARLLEHPSSGLNGSDKTLEQVLEVVSTQRHEIFVSNDGRSISIVRTPTPDGGWVATHEDVTEQKHAEQLLAEQAAELRTVNARFDAAINNMPQGLCLIDADRRLRDGQPSFLRDLRTSGGAGAGRRIRRRVLIREIAARGFMPEDMSPSRNSSAWRPKLRSQLVVSARRADDFDPRSPIPGGGLIATHEDVTERRSAERRLAENASALKRANERFEVAINNMPQGVCLFDAEQRVVIANTRYAELYHLDPEQVKAGTSLTQIFEASSQAGTNFAVAPDTYLRGNVRKEQEVHEVADGRIVSISRRLMSDGGWLTTHEDITDRAQSERRVAYMAQHDMLTGLANRALFAEKLDEASKRHKRHGDGFAVLMLDLDKFKAVNDTLGHPAGDQLLKEVAARLKASLRETDVLARLGGDEFAIIQDGEVEQHRRPSPLRSGSSK